MKCNKLKRSTIMLNKANTLKGYKMTSRRMVLVAAVGHGSFGTTLGDAAVANWTVSCC